MGAKSVAQQLHEYMQHRAASEGVAYDLSPSFFESGLRKGIRLFFGVKVDRRKLISDSQAPAIFAEWQSRQGTNMTTRDDIIDANVSEMLEQRREIEERKALDIYEVAMEFEEESEKVRASGDILRARKLKAASEALTAVSFLTNAMAAANFTEDVLTPRCSECGDPLEDHDHGHDEAESTQQH
jgi:hypothetical protein